MCCEGKTRRPHEFTVPVIHLGSGPAPKLTIPHTLPPSRARTRAERRLLDTWVSQARSSGCRPHQVVRWVRRKVGSDIVVWRVRADGSAGCSLPCVLCQRQLQLFGLRVTCTTSDGRLWRGHLGKSDDSPVCKSTSGQRRGVFAPPPLAAASAQKRAG